MALVYAFLTAGSEEVECLACVDVLRRAGIETKLVALGSDRIVTGSHDISIVCDACIDEVDLAAADVLFIPGGLPGTTNMAADKKLCNALVKQAESGKRVAAICAAPSVFGGLGLLKGKTATCFPGFEDKLEGASYTYTGVVTDGNVTTARGLGYALDLGIEIVKLLIDEDKAMQIKASIQYEDR